MANVTELKRLRETLEFQHTLNHHRQLTWLSRAEITPDGKVKIDCGTTACAAGWVGITDERTVWLSEGGWLEPLPGEEADARMVDLADAPDFVPKMVYAVHVSARAKRILELTDDEALRLFRATTTHGEVIGLIDRLIEMYDVPVESELETVAV